MAGRLGFEIGARAAQRPERDCALKISRLQYIQYEFVVSTAEVDADALEHGGN
jgi:hypothetical protein